MNKPVAWTSSKELTKVTTKNNPFEAWKDKYQHTDVPLYTHPVKELTDFEIKGVLALDECWIGEDCSIPDMIAFAKAILRKAQEK